MPTRVFAAESVPIFDASVGKTIGAM